MTESGARKRGREKKDLYSVRRRRRRRNIFIPHPQKITSNHSRKKKKETREKQARRLGAQNKEASESLACSLSLLLSI